MLRYVVKRLLWLIPVVIGVTIFIFSIMYMVPGDPARIILGSDASQIQINELREQMGLNDPYIVQLGRYMNKVLLHFDFGESYTTGIPIVNEVVTRMPRSLAIGFFAMILSMAIGIPLGVMAAVHQNGWGDRICMVIALLCVSIPNFWLAMLFVLLFALHLGWLPASGISSWTCYIMPIAVQAINGVGGQARQARSSMLEVIRSDYVVTARSKGLSENEVIVKHALPNALLPIVTMAGSQLAHIFGGSVVLENVFSIPGVGQYMISGINNRDYPVVEACVIMLAIIFSIVMLIVDLSYAFIDPRIKAQYVGKKKKVKSNA
jgi:peptide/nickel transport system permease protein